MVQMGWRGWKVPEYASGVVAGIEAVGEEGFIGFVGFVGYSTNMCVRVCGRGRGREEDDEECVWMGTTRKIDQRATQKEKRRLWNLRETTISSINKKRMAMCRE